VPMSNLHLVAVNASEMNQLVYFKDLPIQWPDVL
jgi:hypothetical protein